MIPLGRIVRRALGVKYTRLDSCTYGGFALRDAQRTWVVPRKLNLSSLHSYSCVETEGFFDNYTCYKGFNSEIKLRRMSNEHTSHDQAIKR